MEEAGLVESFVVHFDLQDLDSCVCAKPCVEWLTGGFTPKYNTRLIVNRPRLLNGVTSRSYVGRC